MEIIGTWKAGKILSASDAGETFITVEEFLALPDEQKDDAIHALEFAKTSRTDFILRSPTEAITPPCVCPVVT